MEGTVAFSVHWGLGGFLALNSNKFIPDIETQSCVFYSNR